MENELPPQKKNKGHSPQFSAHVYSGQPAGWIKVPVDTKVGLGPGDIVLDGNFRVCIVAILPALQRLGVTAYGF